MNNCRRRLVALSYQSLVAGFKLFQFDNHTGESSSSIWKKKNRFMFLHRFATANEVRNLWPLHISFYGFDWILVSVSIFSFTFNCMFRCTLHTWHMCYPLKRPTKTKRAKAIKKNDLKPLGKSVYRQWSIIIIERNRQEERERVRKKCVRLIAEIIIMHGKENICVMCKLIFWWINKTETDWKFIRFPLPILAECRMQSIASKRFETHFIFTFYFPMIFFFLFISWTRFELDFLFFSFLFFNENAFSTSLNVDSISNPRFHSNQNIKRLHSNAIDFKSQTVSNCNWKSDFDVAFNYTYKGRVREEEEEEKNISHKSPWIENSKLQIISVFVIVSNVRMNHHWKRIYMRTLRTKTDCYRFFIAFIYTKYFYVYVILWWRLTMADDS